MIVIGLTGSSGSGKTTVSSLLQKRGIDIIDCDRIARDVLRPETGCLSRIFTAFGETVKNEDGTLNRRALAGIVFHDREQLKKLEDILYPQIMADIKALLKQAEAAGSKAVILDAPTLFESGADALCDTTVCVVAEEEKRIKRIMERDHIDYDMAQSRLSSQHTNAFYEEKSDDTIRNYSNIEALEQEIDRFLLQLKNK